MIEIDRRKFIAGGLGLIGVGLAKLAINSEGNQISNTTEAAEKKTTFLPDLPRRVGNTQPITGRETPIPTPTRTPERVNFDSFPPELRPLIQKLRVPDGLYLYLTPAKGSGRCGGHVWPGNYNIGLSRIELYEGWETCYNGNNIRAQMLWGLGHELGHALQHRTIIDAGLASQSIELWLRTDMGKAFIAAGGRSNLPSNPSVNQIEDFANIFSAYYYHQDELKLDPKMFAFAQNTFPLVKIN